MLKPPYSIDDGVAVTVKERVNFQVDSIRLIRCTLKSHRDGKQTSEYKNELTRLSPISSSTV